MKNAVTDYLLNLTDDDLIKIAADFLGWDHWLIDFDTALQWVDGLADDEVKTIWAEMEGE